MIATALPRAARRQTSQRRDSPAYRSRSVVHSRCMLAAIVLHFDVSRASAASSPFAREAAFVSEVGHLSDADIARATGAAASTARAWLGGTRAPTGERAERLVELSALVERLTRVMDPSYIAVWLRKPVPALDDDKPLEVIARGDYRRVAKLVSALAESPTT
jgi:Protein of unknown function (DUF2384)